MELIMIRGIFIGMPALILLIPILIYVAWEEITLQNKLNK
jgi:hypothetical protein